jgi:glyoxylase-like metal-dependent hydrolase (beta-lactamase superfamily II)
MKTMRTPFRLKSLVLLVLTLVGFCNAAQSAESLRLQKVNAHIYAVVGPLGNRTPENLGNNATFGFVVTEAGVVLIDSGGSYLGAAAIDKVIQQVTDKPVKVVINTGGQDHRWLGNGYFKARGARIIASAAAVADQRQRFQDQMFMLGNLVGVKGLEGTEPVYADETFVEQTRVNLGGVQFEIKRLGPAHTPGDSIVWLPKEKAVFTGDIVFVGRLLGILEYSDSRGWIKAFEAMAALKPSVVIPGHGPVTDLARARKDTYDYLKFLRESVGAFMEEGGDITRIGTLDQSRFKGLQNYDALKGRNAQQVYQAMEWE